MNITIVGGGRVGYYLVKTLLPNGHNIVLIESNRQRCEELANDLSMQVIHGDGTNIEVLRKAGVDGTNTFISVAGKDQINLIACQIAKKSFGVERTLARVNNPKNIELFKTLGVDMPIASTAIIADNIEQEVDYHGLKTISKMRDGEIAISEILINEDSPVCNKTLMELKIPKQCVVTSVIRGHEYIIPNGQTKINNGDTIITVTATKDQLEIGEYFLNTKLI